MAEFHVKIRELEAAADAFEKLAPLLAQIESEVSSVKRGLSFQIQQRQQIEARLTRASQRLSSQNGAMRRLAAAGKESARLYQTSEDKLVEMPERKVESVKNAGWLSGMITKVGSILDIIKNKPHVLLPWMNSPILKFYKEGISVGGPVGTVSGSLLEGAWGISRDLGAIAAGGTVLSGEATAYGSATFDPFNKNISAEVGFDASGSVAHGAVEAHLGNLADFQATATVGEVGASGNIGASLFDKDGHLSPSLQADLSGKASVLSGEVRTKVGTDDLNYSMNASGEVLSAEAEAHAGIGEITVHNPDGSTSKEYGVSADVAAGVHVAIGSASGCIEILGIKIGGSVAGDIGAGVSAGGSVTSGSASFNVGAALGLGLEIGVNIDWSGFKLPKLF